VYLIRRYIRTHLMSYHCSERALESTFQNENVQSRLNYCANNVISLRYLLTHSTEWTATMVSEQTCKLALSSKQLRRIRILTFSIDVFVILHHDVS